ncbi:MAG: hypothetical protein JOZ37_14160 [Actinobacteria bacterium]|nr:hypothetical protein [Actinomycetota bacterium]MBV9254110.1 hypothetical protein [Actinomycetota bacterium]MBV9665108.1 hypothetical protein [Actinomycetota bacterium]
MDKHLEDHLVGLEQQVVELVEQERRAELQGDSTEAARLEQEVFGLYTEMARTAELITAGGYSTPVVEADAANHLDASHGIKRSA